MGPAAVAILLGSRVATRSADTHYPFRQDSDFWYLTGFDQPNAAAVLRTGEGAAFALYVEPREPEAERWTGIRPGVVGAVSDYGADEAHPIAELPEAIPSLLEGAQRIYYVHGRNPELDATLTSAIDQMRLRSRSGHMPPDITVDPRSLVHEMRLFKDEYEIETLRRAAGITTAAHQAAAALAHGGTYEYELEAVLDYTFRRRGATGPAYPSIVGGGRNATILHYITNDQKLENGQLVLVDAGCELDGYASDVTRTYPVGGRFEGAGRAIYEIVLAAQREATVHAQPGKTLADVHDAAVRRLTEGLIDLDLLEGTVDDCIERGEFRKFYMHNTSHWLGLDVHDVGAYRIGGQHRPLAPGMVLTVEPGLYVDPDEEGVDLRYRGIGVRIEDDVLITETGHEVLTETIPKDSAEVEAWVRAGG